MLNLSMKFLLGILLLIITATGIAMAQDASALLKEGQQLSSEKKYPEAIEKYKSVLAAEPDNARVNYEMAYVLFASGKGLAGVPYLDKAIKANASVALTAASYSLLGSIYGDAKQFQKSVEAYKEGIKADSTNQRIYYNLGIAFYRNKQYADAGQSFISAIKRDSADAGSVRMYALSAFHQNKRVDALLGFCRFLQLEPNTPRSKEAFGNLQNILQKGTLPPEPGYQPPPTVKAEALAQNKIINKVLAGFITRKYASQTALLTAQLKELFSAFGDGYMFGAYFSKLAQTDNFPVFVRVISQSTMHGNG
jgi:tetratricopeptide (TPR) repeat protein